MKTLCPACQSTNAKRAPDQWRFDVSDAFRVFPRQRCGDCGHQWEPPAPAWLLVLGVSAGLGLIALGVWLFVTDAAKYWSRALVILLLGIGPLCGCLQRLRARRRKDS